MALLSILFVQAQGVSDSPESHRRGPIADGPGVRSTPIPARRDSGTIMFIPARRDSGTIMFILARRDSGTIMFILVWRDSNKIMLSRLGGNPAQ